MRSAAENAVKAFQDWAVGIDYREDVYKAIKAFADTHPKLSGEDAKLLKETLRDYRRAGLDLPPDQRKEVEQLRKELSKLGTDFDTNIVKANAPVIFTKADLDGLPESFFASPGIKTGDDAYTVMANVTWQFNTVEENAKSEETRKQLYVIRETLAKDANVPVLNQMLALRNKIALRLGYKSWDDFQTEVKMAKTGANAEKYISDLVTGIQPKFDSEVAELQKLKAADTNDPNAKIEVWDWRYYANQRNKQKYAVDKEALRAYFPFQKVLDGMFNIYQSIFRSEIREDRRALQMDRRSPALHRDRFRHGRTARDVLSRYVSARRKIQSLRAIRNHQRQTVARWKIPAANRRVALQLFATGGETSHL